MIVSEYYFMERRSSPNGGCFQLKVKNEDIMGKHTSVNRRGTWCVNEKEISRFKGAWKMLQPALSLNSHHYGGKGKINIRTQVANCTTDGKNTIPLNMKKWESKCVTLMWAPLVVMERRRNRMSNRMLQVQEGKRGWGKGNLEALLKKENSGRTQ